MKETFYLEDKREEQEHYMREAIEEALLAQAQGDVPVGCVIVQKGEIIARGHNAREALASPLAHGEIVAISRAAEHLGRWRLEDCSLYVTLEPCAMCTGAIINSKIPRVYFGAWEEKTGCCGSVVNLFMEGLGKGTALTGGILQKECQKLLSDFFSPLR